MKDTENEFVQKMPSGSTVDIRVSSPWQLWSEWYTRLDALSGASRNVLVHFMDRLVCLSFQGPGKDVDGMLANDSFKFAVVDIAQSRHSFPVPLFLDDLEDGGSGKCGAGAGAGAREGPRRLWEIRQEIRVYGPGAENSLGTVHTTTPQGDHVWTS